MKNDPKNLTQFVNPASTDQQDLLKRKKDQLPAAAA